MFIGNAVQEIIQTNKNGEFAGHVQIKTTLDSRGPWLDQSQNIPES